jgi:maleylpyruvate isomerase
MDDARDPAPSGTPPRSPAWDPGDLTGLEASAIELNRTVDALTADDLTGPSLLPGWTRAHVVAHVALNGLALANVLDAVGRGEPVAMYESDEQRDAEINEFAQAGPDALREGLLATTTAFADAVAAMEPDRWDGSFNRLPGGPAWPVVTIVPTRRREVEIHHADLGTAYTHQQWPDDFVVELLDVVCVDRASEGPFQLRATDLGRDWQVGGEGGPTVLGTGGELGWWLTGRSTGDALTTDGGQLPPLGPWRRASATPLR